MLQNTISNALCIVLEKDANNTALLYFADSSWGDFWNIDERELFIIISTISNTDANE